MIKVFLPITTFNAEIQRINTFLGLPNEHFKTWQTEPIEYEGKGYIRFKSQLTPYVTQYQIEVIEITVNEP